jgi:hypothetical protein
MTYGGVIAIGYPLGVIHLTKPQSGNLKGPTQPLKPPLAPTERTSSALKYSWG